MVIMKYLVVLLLLMLASTSQAQVKLTLEEAITMSQEHSFSLKSSRYDSAAAASEYQAARSGRFPVISLNAATFYIDELQTVSLLPTRTIELGSNENYQTDVRLSLPLYTGGRLSAQIDIQRENLNFRSYGLEAERLNAAYTARRAYLGLIMSSHLVRTADASLQRISIIQKDVDNLHAVGMADSVDILDASLAYQKGKQTLVEYETTFRNSSILLAQVTGLDAESEILPAEEIPLPNETRTISPEKTEIVRPELKQSDSRVKISKHLVGINRAGLFPTVSGYVGYSAGKPNRDLFNAEWNDYFHAGVTLNWEFNLGGKTIHSTRSAGQAMFSSQMAREKIKEQLTLQADLARNNLKRAFQNFVISRTEYDIATRKYRLGQEKHKAGEISINRLLELEAELTAAEQLYQVSVINYYLAESEYLYAVGDSRIFGGFTNE